MENFWIWSILHHCKCFKGNEDKNDGEYYLSLEMLGKDGKTMDGKCPPSLEMFKELKIQWMGSAPHCPSHITPKSCFTDGEHSLLPLPMSTKNAALQMGSAPYVACPLTGFQHLAYFLSICEPMVWT
jgi:hypothetical protein